MSRAAKRFNYFHEILPKTESVTQSKLNDDLLNLPTRRFKLHIKTGYQYRCASFQHYTDICLMHAIDFKYYFSYVCNPKDDVFNNYMHT